MPIQKNKSFEARKNKKIEHMRAFNFIVNGQFVRSLPLNYSCDYKLPTTDAIFFPLTRAWGAGGCDEAGWGRPNRNPGRAGAYYEVCLNKLKYTTLLVGL